MIPGINRNGIIISYEVRYAYAGGPAMLVTPTGAELSTVLRNLNESEAYSIQVRAYTSVGPGPYSDPVTSMTQEDSESRSLFFLLG